MRPVRIELDGFGAFRRPTTVDLTDADLFAFVGPTGAGKSTVIDGMVFALYGSVPRYGQKNLVHPVISQQLPEARVRLDFEVDGVAHTAVRVVRRTRTGASTKEARLERGSDVLAADADAVTAAVEELLGLDLEQFTKCVVLPQGAFAALLHDTTSKRQDLLVKLLDLGVYEQVAHAARRRAAAAEQRVTIADEQLAVLVHATDDAVAASAARVAELGALVEQIDAARPELAALAESIRDLDQRRAEIERRAADLAGLRVPPGVADIALRRAEADAAALAAADAERAAAADHDAARAARADLADPAETRELLARHSRHADLAARVEKGTTMVDERAAVVTPLVDAAVDAAAAVAAAEAAVASARIEHAAIDLGRHLGPGDDCPVCGATVGDLPARDAQSLEAAEAELDRARAAHRAADRDVRAAETELAGLRATLDERRAQLDDAGVALAGTPTPAELEERLVAVEAADARLDDAAATDRAARAAAERARVALAEATTAEADARRELTRARDLVAAHGPPATTDDLAADWSALVDWAAGLAARLRADDAELVARRDDLVRARADLLTGLTAAATGAGLTVAEPEAVRDAAVAALADERARHGHLVADRDRAAALRADRAVAADDRAVHELLASELGPKRFEAWLLDEALTALVEGASDRLEALSTGRYALAVGDKGHFEVVDHANADERRLARTLSGGETFLASLALALALAERVTELSGGSHARLEAIFLDEGFGTLDPEALDVVASAIEELGAQGRMVGVVSHVRELAERVPLRFEVRQTPETSTVERVEA